MITDIIFFSKRSDIWIAAPLVFQQQSARRRLIDPLAVG